MFCVSSKRFFQLSRSTLTSFSTSTCVQLMSYLHHLLHKITLKMVAHILTLSTADSRLHHQNCVWLDGWLLSLSTTRWSRGSRSHVLTPVQPLTALTALCGNQTVALLGHSQGTQPTELSKLPIKNCKYLCWFVFVDHLLFSKIKGTTGFEMELKCYQPGDITKAVTSYYVTLHDKIKLS